MNILSRIKKALTRTVYVQSQYRAAETFSFDRSWLPQYVQDADQDINSQVRIECMRKARYFEQNSAIVQKILDLIEVNTVGNGITPTPKSGDEKWDEAALAAWNKWVKRSDLSSRLSFYKQQSIAARSKAVDGDIFVLKVARESGWPRLQLIESHRVGSFGKPYDGLTDCDGVWVDEDGRPQYYVVHGSGKKKPKIIEADRMIHIVNPARAGQHRGLTIFHSVLHTLHDLDDLQQYEMVAAKDASSRANIVYTESGEMPNQAPIGASLRKTVGEETLEQKQAIYEKAFGGKTIALKRGDKWEQSQALRPSAAMREFWEYLTQLTCKGVGISYAAVNDYAGGLGGAALRGAGAADDRFYKVCSDDLNYFNDEVWRFVIPLLAQQGEIGPLPENWDNVQWQFPRRMTVDIGHDSKAMLEELRAGVRTLRDIHGDLGHDWREKTRQRITELKFIRDEANAAGVDSGLVLGMLGAGPTSTTYAEKASEAIDGPPETPDLASGDSANGGNSNE